MKIANKEQYLAEILLSIYDSANTLFNDERWNGSEDIFLKLIAENELLLAYCESDVVGFITYNNSVKGYLIITGLYVKKDYQKRGIASNLLYALIENISDTKVMAEVINNATWAKNFYEKNDFSIIPKEQDIAKI